MEYEMMKLKDAKKALQAASKFLEVHSESNHNKRTFRIHQEIDIQVDRLEDLIDKDSKEE